MKRTMRVVALLLIMAVMMASVPIMSNAATGITITVDNVTAEPGETVTVPISVSNNTGICGAKITVSYDSGLSLVDIAEGTALSSLTMTKPGDLSANPFNLVWDGMEEDASNGTVAYLTFTVPQQNGVYNISLSCKQNGVVDGNLKSVAVSLQGGSITVSNDTGSGFGINKVTVKFGEKTAVLSNPINKTGKIIIAQYGTNDTLLSVKQYIASDTIVAAKENNATYAKIFWWEDITNIKPLCNKTTVILK